MKGIPKMIKVKEIIKLLENNGWRLVRTKGSHKQFQHRDNPELGTITVAGHPSVDMPKGTANAILKQARLKE
jgi:predicted RNA binding protein YcfA (HicA-like mRNA interferase family)